jgi:hypothetical protein
MGRDADVLRLDLARMVLRRRLELELAGMLQTLAAPKPPSDASLDVTATGVGVVAALALLVIAYGVMLVEGVPAWP